ncbi:SMI1/KNR4 family protein [Actinoplanes sp. NPDC049118]|uniref:SMI1/KNR4 family protein n=1 Tax=Actinoplanes sp. NPDC049118 TaxID=3155769 RepID=UPI0033CA4C74
MDQRWPDRGPWVIAATSADVDWRIAATALAATAAVPVAAVVVGDAVAGDDPLRPHLAGLLELPVADRLTLEQARDLVRALSRTHDLVLVAAGAGLLVPVGRDGWTPADLAAAVGAPAVVVTGPGPDAVNHTTLALGALAGHGIAAAVVTIGEVDEAALPVRPAGRIPAGPPTDFAEAADWLDPMLRVTAGPPPPDPAAAPRRPPVSGKRFVLALLAVFAVFVVMVVVVCGLAWWDRSPAEVESRVSVTGGPAPGLSRNGAPVPGPSLPLRRRTAADVCPQHAGPVAVTHPDAAATERVNAAWRRIEKWLAAHAPAGRRALRAPAPAARIDELQRRMSVAFPADLVASLRRHDGVSAGGRFTLPPFFAPETLDGILEDWQVTCGVLAGAGSTWTDPWWDRAFVPFAAAGDGGTLVADQRPGGHGRVGEFYPEDGTSFATWPGSIAELLELTATSLETGRPFAGRYRPHPDAEGGLDWEIK